jgi:putative transcriptional regulator
MTVYRPLLRLARCLAAASALAFVAPAPAAEPDDEPVLLVAKPALRDRLYGATILIVRPVGRDRHIGFIVNRPTPVTLGKLFPDHGPSQKVVDPVYLGGPASMEVLFALVQQRESPGRSAVQLTPDLYLASERDLVDRIIETASDHARFYAGLVIWAPGELRAEIERGFWYVDDADASLVLRKSTRGMWEELVKRLESKPKGLRTSL